MKSLLKLIGIMVVSVMLLGISPVRAQEEHKEIVEEVSVNWWLVPVFAVDDEGRPARYLEAKDIEIMLNGRIMPTFELNKRIYSVTERSQQTVQTPSAQQVPLDKKKVIFLLFDQALSAETSTQRAKEVAKKIIMDADTDTKFFLLAIDPFAGLVFAGEGSGSNKTELLRLLKKDVVERRTRRAVDPGELFRDMGGDGKGRVQAPKYEGKEYGLFSEAASKPFKRESMGFFTAFETLYFYLNAVEDNKFVYLFSEGMSESVLLSNRSLAGSRGMYQFYLKKVAEMLNRCGAVFFLINTMGVDQHTSTFTTSSQTGGEVLDSSSFLSGEESLLYLAKKSGGTYLEGVEDQIVEKIENMHLAYYEISFPDPPQLEKNATRDIVIKSKQKGINIYSMRSLEKRKHYTNMNSVEKDMLVLNLVTQPANILIKSKINAYNAKVEKSKDSPKEVVYSVTLPPSFLKKNLDLYKVWLEVNEQGGAQLQKVEKENLYPQKDKLTIPFPLTEDKKQQKEDKEKGKTEIQTFFVLINGGVDPARASVHGFELYDEDPELPEEAKPVFTQVNKVDNVTDKGLQALLDGAADYCDRLKQSAFHFYCQEKIVETRLPLTDAEMDVKAIDEEAMRKGVIRTLDEMRNKAYTKVSGYIFGYRLIKKGASIKEEGDFISSRDNVRVERNEVVKTNAFFSEKAIFAPITLLDRSRQGLYDFKLVGTDNRHGRKAAVIEAVPKNPVETATIYGRIWIDTEDFSVLRIDADPKSIRSYNLLKELASKMRTRLLLSLELDFNLLHEGIRFPTKVAMLEKYKGGRIISEYRGNQGWERTRAEFDYSDYQFFSVQTDVEINDRQ